MAVLLMQLTALPLLLLVLLLTTRLAHGLPLHLLATKMSALVPSLLALLQLLVDARLMAQLALPPMPVAYSSLVVLVLSTLPAQTATSSLSVLPSSLSFLLSDEVKKIHFLCNFIARVCSL